MNIIERAKNIMFSPAKEWDVVATETPNIAGIVTGYVLPLAGAAAIAAFIGYGFIGFNYGFLRIHGVDWGIYQAISILLNALLVVFVSSFVIDLLAPSFGSEKNMGRSVQVVAYSMTPAWVGGLLNIIPALALVGGLVGLYGFYLLYVGMMKLKNTPQDKQIGYFIVSLLVMLIVYLVIGYIIGRIMMSVLGLSYGALSGGGIDIHI